nr:PREDICTED: uncharacterized protein LOC103279680 [Anolis carolinensis]|eukprot:XP_008114268.1 PREDICTED: uncharacterized protein LOC103279680 [Anolis carolinensis]
MAIYIHQLFLMAADLTLASAVSCALYGLACVSVASLVGLLFFLLSVGAIKCVKRTIARKVNTIQTLVSKSTLGSLLLRKRDQTGLGELAVAHAPEKGRDFELEKECSSNMEVAQLQETKEKCQKARHTLTERPLSLKGVSDGMKKPSVITKEETKTPNEYERKYISHKQKTGFRSLTVFIALLWTPVEIMCPCLKKRIYQFLDALQKSED